MSSRKRVGLLGGTFNPPHFGHLNLARELGEKHRLDEVWWLPTRLNPEKLGEKIVDSSCRLEMVRLAIKDDPYFALCLEELHRPPPSYTVDTLRALHVKYKEVQFFLLLGEDAAARFVEWKEPLEILRLAKVLVGTRPSQEKQMPLEGNSPIFEAIRAGWTPIRQMEISSRSIRERILARRSCSHLVPKFVLDYILSCGLYSE